MGYTEQLDGLYSRHLMQYVRDFEFKITNKLSQGIGAQIQLKNEDLHIILSVDRGIPEFEIGPNKKPFQLISTKLLISYFKLKEAANDLSPWARKKIIGSRLGIEDEITWVFEHYQELLIFFSKSNLNDCINEMNQLVYEEFKPPSANGTRLRKKNLK